jgi:hypothetical protein
MRLEGTLDPSETDTTRGTFSQTKEHTFSVGDSVLSFVPYFAAEVERFGPASGPDTLAVWGGAVQGCILDSCRCGWNRPRVQLVKGRGLIYRNSGCFHGVSSDREEEWITRREANQGTGPARGSR